ncbi:MAG: hypothetical protein WC749_00750 [Dehalococcoidia bacterium]|uniref:hypothetical protein n=1 Tax=Pseudomonas sp. WS 5086 TaxID=2717484 RepID=UPI0014728955|nr:hypothetical protein [Pseudomonas sp. WS 5086]NMX92530.1 hypothetical protein [Pseudomonas sp. WS 5086]
MELLDQIEQSGLRVVDGKRRLQAALEDGRTVTASGGDGKVYSISMQQGTVNVFELSGAQVIDTGFSFDAIFIPVASLTSGSANVRASDPKAS